MKSCTICKTEKSFDSFYKKKSSKDGLRSYCKECQTSYYKKYNAEHKEQVYNYKKKYKSNNLEKVKNSYSEWCKRNPGKSKEYCLIWSKNNPEKIKLKSIKYRLEKLYRSIVDIDFEEIQKVYKNCPSGYEVDHIIPLKGKQVSGLHVSWNLQYLLSSENRAKRHLFDFTYNNTSWKK